MACDGHIDEQEIEEIKKMDKNTTYFGDVDLTDELDALLKDLKLHGKKVVNDLFQELRDTELDPVQELLLLEVALRIIHADEKIRDNELKFLKLLRGRLAVFDEIIIERFGKNVLLFDKAYKDEVKISEIDYVDEIELPKFSDFSNLNIAFNKEK